MYYTRTCIFYSRIIVPEILDHRSERLVLQLVVDRVGAQRVHQCGRTYERQARPTYLAGPARQLEVLLGLHLYRALLEACARVSARARDERAPGVDVRRGPHAALEVYARVRVSEIAHELLDGPARIQTAVDDAETSHPFVNHIAFCSQQISEIRSSRYNLIMLYVSQYVQYVCVRVCIFRTVL